MKVHRDDAASALHQPIARHRRIDAAREQRDDTAADTGRHAARAGFLPEVVERLARERLDVDRELRIVEVDGPSLRFLDATAHFALDLRRRQRKSLVGPLRRHAERGHPQIAEIARGWRSRCRRRRAARARRAKNSRCRTRGAAARPPAPTRPDAEDDLDAPHLRDRRACTSRSLVAVLMLRTSRAMNHGRLRPLSAISW